VSLSGGKCKSCYGRTRKEVQEKLRAALRDLDAGLDPGTSRQTVGQFLDRWIADVVTPTLAPKTVSSYRDVGRVHLIPELGRYELRKLTPQHVQALLRAKEAAGLSPRTVSYIRTVLRIALNRALK
jgi:integrase